MATKKGAFSLQDAKVIADALIELQKVLGINTPETAPMNVVE